MLVYSYRPEIFGCRDLYILIVYLVILAAEEIDTFYTFYITCSIRNFNNIIFF